MIDAVDTGMPTWRGLKFVIIPYHIRRHFLVIKVDFITREFIVYDSSLYTANEHRKQAVEELMRNIILGMKEAKFYTEVAPEEEILKRVDLTTAQIPQQADDYSCGALVCHFILTLLTVPAGYWRPGVNIQYPSSRIKTIRKEITRLMFKYNLPVIDHTPPEEDYPEQYE